MPTGHRRDQPTFTPDPDEIRAACAEIRKEWDDDEEFRRRVTKCRDTYPTGAHMAPTLESLGSMTGYKVTVDVPTKTWKQKNQEYWERTHGDTK